MTGKTHQALGITAGLTYYLATSPVSYNPATLGAVVVVSYFSALLPDIDQPASKVWHSIPFGHTVGKVASPFLEHRNLSHSFLGFGIVALTLHYIFYSMPTYWGINPAIIFSVSLIAYGAHLLADMITIEGIPLFYPIQTMIGLPPKPLEGIRIETGKWFENLIIFPIINITLFVVIISYLQKIRSILLK